jgi:hypothetical protein
MDHTSRYTVAMNNNRDDDDDERPSAVLKAISGTRQLLQRAWAPVNALPSSVRSAVVQPLQDVGSHNGWLLRQTYTDVKRYPAVLIGGSAIITGALSYKHGYFPFARNVVLIPLLITAIAYPAAVAKRCGVDLVAPPADAEDEKKNLKRGSR